MSRFMTNSNVIDLFKEIDELKANGNLPEDQLTEQIKQTQNKIVEGLGFLVYSNARMYRKFSNYEDLVQEGFIGLIRAVRKFNHNLFPNFFVYSERWIKHGIKRAASRFDVVYNPDKTRVVYAEPADIGKEEEDQCTPEEIFFNKEVGQKIEEVLNEFTDRERDIVKRIFGLGGGLPETLREIGPDFNLTHERIRQIKDKVVLKLRKNASLNKINEIR